MDHPMDLVKGVTFLVGLIPYKVIPLSMAMPRGLKVANPVTPILRREI